MARQHKRQQRVQPESEVDEQELSADNEDEAQSDGGCWWGGEGGRMVEDAKINVAEAEPDEIPRGPWDKHVFSLYADHIARHIFDGWVSYKFNLYNLIKRNYFIIYQGHL
jgi:hypothetical protein